MDQSFARKMLLKIGIAILALALVDLVYINWWVLQDQSQKSKVKSQNLDQSATIASTPIPNPDASASPTTKEADQSQSSPATKTETNPPAGGQKETQTIVQTAQKEIFVPIGSGSTFSHDYADLSGLKVTIDTTKYSAIDSAYFEASIWLQDGNGKMYTQLFNETDKHPVWNSEMSTSSATSTFTTSAKINLDSGAKTYKIQAKTNLTAYAAHVDNARIHIILK